ncbi:hypothetical protein PFICI_00813 [Pestalotiopsis fici W106-1]|uniref:Protein kinase domain-containing protein n=1 Tax=Pestalotiopsis fici (strain W106-1 / CGMCC3.15140) TaxID=1229662 RepID=W3XLY6_PESFW|nr:uncharacterized protein PFICI_00813 [Pestalotiopsis fici W106-1]ETS86985.1 hypothetical protein PFICI_00813 [Pestalotiopsis fici W106-1]
MNSSGTFQGATSILDQESLFERPRLFSSYILDTSEDAARYNLITFLAAVQGLDLGIFSIPWQSARRAIGDGGTSQISQASVNPETSIAFKRVSTHDKLQLDDGEILRRLLSEILVLGHPEVRDHPHILDLQGVSWDVSVKADENNASSASAASPSSSAVYPVLMFEMSRHGDLYNFAKSPNGQVMTIAARLEFCFMIGTAIATMHANHIIHGDIKPNNVIVSKLEDDSFIPKVADFGYSSPPAHQEVPIQLPRSWPWNAPELDEYPSFTPAQATTADVFSYGVLCFWFIFEKYLSGVEPLPEVGEITGLNHGFENQDASWKNLADLRRNNINLVQLSEYLISSNKDLDAQSMSKLRRFFSATLAYDAMERGTDLSELLSYLDPGQELIKEEADAFQYNAPADYTFHLNQSLRSLYLCDFRVRSHIVACLEEIVLADPKGPLAAQLGLCYAIGFGQSTTVDEQQRVQAILQASSIDTKAILEQGPMFIENATDFMTDLAESRYMAEMDSLADTYREHDVLEEAATVTKHEFESLSRIMGPDHPILADLANILSLIMHSMGQWEEAEKFAKYQADFLEKTLGDKDSDTLQSKLHLAGVYWEQGRWQEAEKMEQGVMDVCLSEFGRHHALTLSCMASMTATFREQGRFEEAEKLGIETMQGTRQLFGPEHPTTLANMTILAALYHRLGRLDEAIELQTEISETSERVQGFDHPDSIVALSTLAQMYWDEEIWKQGLELQFDAMDAATRVLGSSHPETLKMTAAFANMYRELGEYEEAEKLQRQVIDERKRTIGDEHPDTLTGMAALALTLGEQGKRNEEEEIELAVLETRKRLFGPKHPDTLTMMSNLAFTWKDMGENDSASALMQECLKLRQEELGNDHLDTIETLQVLEEWDDEEWESAEDEDVEMEDD